MKVKKITLVADPYPPYQFTEHGKLKGIDYQYITSILEAAGYEPTVKLMGWNSCLQELNSNQAEGIFQITRTIEREKKYIFSELLRKAETTLFTRKDKSIDIRGKGDLGDELDISLGRLAGYNYHPQIDSVDSKFIVEVENQEDLLRGLQKNQFNAAVLDVGVAEYLQKKLDITAVQQVPGFSVQRELFVAFRKNCTQLAEQFNSQLRAFKNNDILGKIMDKYGLNTT